MDLQNLADESRHLPTLTPNSNPNPNLGPKISTIFKREARKKRKERKRQRKLEEKLEHELQTLLALETHSRPSHNSTYISNIEWPSNATDPDPDPNSNVSGWTVPNPNPKPVSPPSASPPDPQTNALKQCRDFFSENDDDDEDEDAFEFFKGLFAKDENLRWVYEKNWEKGDFCCLVCGGIGEKLGKWFGDCIGLVQHANMVLKTKRVGGHRAFGRAVCGVLGWDVDKLPGIFHGQGLDRDCNSQEDVDEVGLHKVGDLVGPDKGELMDYMEADEAADTD